MKTISNSIVIVLFLALASFSLIAQEKPQSYYNRHEKELIPDALEEFNKGNYERTILLCKWYYIIVGDNSAQSLRERAERCAQLTSEIGSLKSEAVDKITNARLLALTLLSINSEDKSVKDFLQWSERTISDTLSSSFVRYLPLQDSQATIEMVDLGLSVKWANCNLGASRPEDVGASFAWGETIPRSAADGDGFNWGNYKWSKGGYQELTRYCTNQDYDSGNYVDYTRRLSPEDDAAHEILGGKWRIPTDKEIQELIKKCSWHWTQSSGIPGYRITSPTTGNSIFLPVLDNQTNYWSSMISDGRPYSAFALVLRSGSYTTEMFARYNGFAIRPVFGK